MTPPPFLLGAALLFWGWQTGFLIVAVPLALVLEGARWIKVRWEFSDQDFSRVWTFCSLLLLASSVYFFNANQGVADFVGVFRNSGISPRARGIASARTAAAVIRWLPVLFFPCIAAQQFSSLQAVPLQAISLIVRRRWRRARELGLSLPQRNINVSYPYFLICLFAASMHTADDSTFFWGVAALAAWALWRLRSRRFAAGIWAATLVVTVGLGFLVQIGFSHLQGYLDHFSFPGFSRRPHHTRQTKTSMGDIGKLKTSGTILIRLEPKKGSGPPPLLREASFTKYGFQTWSLPNHDSDFSLPIAEETNHVNWLLIPDKTNTAAVNIACYLDGSEGLLPLPSGSGRLENLPAYVLEKNYGGAVRAKGPGLVIFDALYGPGATLDSEANLVDDREVPKWEQPALEKVRSELNVATNSLEPSLRAISRFFQTKFDYSLWQEAPQRAWTNETPLARFLLQTRKGHCEFFATATVLLLRQMGFPARYVTGYAVHETSGSKKYVIRQRDSHAWCLVWDKDKQTWRDFDTTPGSWIQAEANHASALQWVADIFSGIRFQLARIRWGQTHLRQYLMWTLAPILAVLLFQILFRSKRQRQRRKSGTLHRDAWPGLDSEFYQLERMLAQRLSPRQTGEPLSTWVQRAFVDTQLSPMREQLHQLLRLHYAYRFDPEGLSTTARETLRLETKTCLARLKG